jgi:DNA-binding transcriptional LysR family regulator
MIYSRGELQPAWGQYWMDSVAAFNVFVRVAETRSFVAAGQLLGISASAVGKSVNRLETRLGVRLFHRSTRSVTLTAEGTILLERSRHILAEIEAAESELSAASTLPRGRLRISLPLVSKPLLPILAEFQSAYPEVELDLDFTDRKVDVIEEGFDAVVRSGDAQDSRLTVARLSSYRMLLVASSRYLAKRGAPNRPADLTEHACIHFRFPNTGKLQAWMMRHPKGEPEIQVPISMICNTLDARLCFALSGLGIAYLPEFVVRNAIADGSLQTVLEKYTTEMGTFRLLWPSGKQLAPKLRVLIDFLRERLVINPRSEGDVPSVQ